MHRYPTRFAAMNRSFFPSSADDAEYNPADDTYDASEDYEAYAAANPYRGYRRKCNSEDDMEFVPEEEFYDESEDYEAYAAANPYKGYRRNCNYDDDEEFVPDSVEDDEDGYDAYVASTGLSLKSYNNDEDYVVNLKDWTKNMGHRPVTRSMTRNTRQRR